MPAVSIITPSHRPDHLARLWESLKAQTFPDWEWVLVPNGPAADRVANARAERFGDDDRVRVCPAPVSVPASVGALKRYGFDLADGDLLVEVDHDDWLADNALAVLVDSRKKTDAGFLFSACLEFGEDGGSVAYPEDCGWAHRPHHYRGRDYVVMDPFPVGPRSLAEIAWAPNHVRAWTRAAYDRAGRHDPRLPVCDDLDLMQRTYLAGVRFCSVPAVLYYQRHLPDSTVPARHADIQRLSGELRHRNLHNLVHEWCRRQKLPRLDLGGAHGCPTGLGYTAVDLPGSGAAVECRLGQDPLPYADGSVGCVRAVDFLEHLPAGEPLVRAMNEIHRVLVPGGWLLSATPSVANPDGSVGLGAFSVPDHLSFWGPLSARYFTDRLYAKFLRGLDVRFQGVQNFITYPSVWHEENRCAYLIMDLMRVTGLDRVPGGTRI